MNTVENQGFSQLVLVTRHLENTCFEEFQFCWIRTSKVLFKQICSSGVSDDDDNSETETQPRTLSM